LFEGAAEGLPVGCELGCALGQAVGARDGFKLGAWERLGAPVGSLVGVLVMISRRQHSDEPDFVALEVMGVSIKLHRTVARADFIHSIPEHLELRKQ
jgi:hypothetical protein